MARDRSRARRAVIDTGEPGGGDVEPDEGESDQDGERPDRSEGSIEDLRGEGRQRVVSETAPGSQADLSIDPSINPGFIDTEVVNRVGLVLGLNLVYDPERGFWTPVTTKDLASSAYSSGLLADTISESLGNVIGDTPGTTVDGDGSLGVDTGTVSGPDLTSDTVGSDTSTSDIYLNFNIKSDVSRAAGKITVTDRPATQVYARDLDDDFRIGGSGITDGTFAFDGDFRRDHQVRLYFNAGGSAFDFPVYENKSLPINTPIGALNRTNWNNTVYGDRVPLVEEIGSELVKGDGTATTAFETPERATQYDKSLFNAEANGGSYRVDLYSGDPNSSSGELLARDISPREDISDIPPSKGPLQLKIHMQRSDQGDSPRVSLAGVQYER